MDPPTLLAARVAAPPHTRCCPLAVVPQSPRKCQNPCRPTVGKGKEHRVRARFSDSPGLNWESVCSANYAGLPEGIQGIQRSALDVRLTQSLVLSAIL